MREHPETASGTRRDVAALMRAVPGLLSKDGFEGVQVAALPDGRAVAVKIADGANRARVPVAAAALARAGVDPALLTRSPVSRCSAAGGRSAPCGRCARWTPSNCRPAPDLRRCRPAPHRPGRPHPRTPETESGPAPS